jgi:hypothetical protein
MLAQTRLTELQIRLRAMQRYTATEVFADFAMKFVCMEPGVRLNVEYAISQVVTTLFSLPLALSVSANLSRVL